MRHYGDITKLSGYELPVVDVITGGSPCQDLSVAGKRAGLAGERSGLFMEQIRVVKEMRERERAAGRTGRYVRPRYMVWENVPGAFSSNGGADFQAVLSEIVKVAEPDAPDVPLPDKGKWPKSGCLYPDMGGWSIAWRLHDAQFWGVPQRRKRIALVADFGGLSAPEILFERKGVSGDSEPCGTEREEAAGAVGGGVEGASGAMNPWDSQSARVYSADGVWHSLNANENGGQSRDSVFCLQGNGIDRADTAGCNGRGWCEDVSYTLNTIDRPAVMAFKQGQGSKAGGIGAQEECSPTLSAVASGTNQVPAVMAFAQNQVGEVRVSPMSGTLNTNSNATGRNSPLVYDARGGVEGAEPIPIHDQATRFKGKHGEKSDGKGNGLGIGKAGEPANTLSSADRHAVFVGNGQLNQMSMAEQANTPDTMHDQQAVMTASIVRRLTPMECERLQGYPDGWTDIGEWTDSKGKKHKDADSPRYKALGNSIALPFWKFLARRICAQYERDITMASLFDGIGGFPLVFERCGAKAVWASEIEEFCVAVTRERFGEN